jgi:23S rRNA pseudouridine1911/1915/1917 synthase
MKIPETLAGLRLDQALAELFPDYSRARLQQWIKAGQVRVDGRQLRAKDKIQGHEEVVLEAEETVATVWEAQAIPLNIVYEDEDILVVDKSIGLVVHPGAGNPDQTLVNALLHHAPELKNLPRAGVVHRLDKDTSGLLVVARSLRAHTRLVEQLQAREFEREYQAVINGMLTAGGTVDAPIGRHPSQRTKMAVSESGRPAISHYRVIERFRVHTLVQVRLETGRTHQIRVHMAHLRHPLVGDTQYGGRPRLPPDPSPELIQLLQHFPRQALHAAKLGLEHPASGEFMEWEAPLPEDMLSLIAALQEDKRAHA